MANENQNKIYRLLNCAVFEINQGSFADSTEKHVLTSCFTDHHHFISAVLLVPLRSHRIQLFVTFETSLFEKCFNELQRAIFAALTLHLDLIQHAQAKQRAQTIMNYKKVAI